MEIYLKYMQSVLPVRDKIKLIRSDKKSAKVSKKLEEIGGFVIFGGGKAYTGYYEPPKIKHFNTICANEIQDFCFAFQRQ